VIGQELTIDSILPFGNQDRKIPTSEAERPGKVSFFLPNLNTGGAERITVYLANGLALCGYKVDVVLGRAEGEFLADIASDVSIIDLKASRTLFAIPKLASYLRAARPDVLISALDYVNVAAILARSLSLTQTRVIAACHVTHSQKGARLKGIVKMTHSAAVRWFYPWSDLLMCVSQGVADDLMTATGLPPERIRVIYNPVIGPELERLACEPVAHPWFATNDVPVIVAVGRLTPAKDFGTLIRAFKLLKKERNARLLIIGEGPERAQLEALVEELDLKSCVEMPGFAKNPYAFVSRAALFVLSSAWEALPTVLIEALALGTRVVSTDCKNGPREILAGGRYGRLSPVGDPVALARAMAETLASEPILVPEEALRPFRMQAALENYCRLIEEMKHA
jgi:glycosyltransferase involved in cell wall biosynthesis